MKKKKKNGGKKKDQNPVAKPILSAGQLWCVSFHTVVNNNISLLGIIGPCYRVFQIILLVTA